MSRFSNWTGTATRGFTVTPSDSTNLTQPARALYVGGAGNISLVTLEGDTVDFPNVGQGSILPVATLRVNATGTTATNIRGLY